MIVRVWGVVNNTEVEFERIPEKPGYWEGYAPRVRGFQEIEVWAENDRGGRGHWNGQVVLEWHTPTRVRLFLAPYSVHLLDDGQNGRDCSPYLMKS